MKMHESDFYWLAFLGSIGCLNICCFFLHLFSIPKKSQNCNRRHCGVCLTGLVFEKSTITLSEILIGHYCHFPSIAPKHKSFLSGSDLDLTEWLPILLYLHILSCSNCHLLFFWGQSTSYCQSAPWCDAHPFSMDGDWASTLCSWVFRCLCGASSFSISLLLGVCLSQHRLETTVLWGAVF